MTGGDTSRLRGSRMALRTWVGAAWMLCACASAVTVPNGDAREPHDARAVDATVIDVSYDADVSDRSPPDATRPTDASGDTGIDVVTAYDRVPLDIADVLDVAGAIDSSDVPCPLDATAPRLAFVPSSCDRLVNFAIGGVAVFDVEATTDTLPVTLEIVSGSGPRSFSTAPAYSGPGRITFRGVALPPGAYQLFLMATDACGRSIRVGPCSITVGAMPALRFLRPLGGAIVTDEDPSTPLVDVTVVLETDAPSGSPIEVDDGRTMRWASVVTAGRATMVIALGIGRFNLRAMVTAPGRGTASATIAITTR